MGLLRRIRAILDKAPPEQDPRDVVIEQQDREIGRLRDELVRHKNELARHKDVHRQNDGLQRQNERLRRENEHLKQQLGAERRAGRRQAAPFAKKRPQGRGGRPGRRPGARYGRQGRRPSPAHVDEALAAPAPTRCPDCGGAVEVTGAAAQYQEDLPPGAPAGAPLRHRGRPLLAVSAAGPGPPRPADLRRVGGGPRTARSRRGRAGRRVAHPRRPAAGQGRRPAADPLRPAGDAGGLQHLLHRAARDARPAYEELREQVRNAPVVTVDETGWRVGAGGHWLWAAVTPTTTVYAICAGRGFDDAQAVLGADFDGVLVRDGWVVYRRYTNGEHQSCVQHLLRRCEQLTAGGPDRCRAPCRQASRCATGATPAT